MSFLIKAVDDISISAADELLRTMTEGTNGTLVLDSSWSEAEKWILVVVLGLEMTMGTAGNILVLIIKVMCRGRFSCRFWFPFLSLTLSDLGCSLLIMSGSMLALMTGGQRSPWCEVVSLLKFAFISSSVGSIAVLSVQRVIGGASCGKAVVVTVCSGSWVIGVVIGCIPVVYSWIRYDPAEMLCAVFWEQSRYSHMLLYVLCSFSICIFLPLIIIIIISCSGMMMMMIPGWTTCCHSDEGDDDDDDDDLCEVLPLLVAFYIICYTPFFVSELIQLGRRDLSPAPDWLRTLSSVMSYLDCGVNPVIYCCHQGFREAALGLLWTRRRPGPEPVLTAIAKLQLA